MLLLLSNIISALFHLFYLIFFWELISCSRYAVVTGSNKGIGFEICRQLASQGITVVLTARDEKRGLEALEKLKGFGLSDFVIFHQLDVSDPASIASFAQFIQSHLGNLDILVTLSFSFLVFIVVPLLVLFSCYITHDPSNYMVYVVLILSVNSLCRSTTLG